VVDTEAAVQHRHENLTGPGAGSAKQISKSEVQKCQRAVFWFFSQNLLAFCLKLPKIRARQLKAGCGKCLR